MLFSASSSCKESVLSERYSAWSKLNSCLLGSRIKSGLINLFPDFPVGSNYVSKSTLREFILLTLSHAESREITPPEIVYRLQQKFICLSIVVSKELHKAEESFHYHIGIHSKSSSKNTCTAQIRSLFQEFEGRQCNVKFHKGFGTVVGYITKIDSSPYVWGVYSLSDILSLGKSTREKKKAKLQVTEVVLETLKKSPDWYSVYKSEEVKSRLIYGSYSNIRSVFSDLQVIKELELSCFERIDLYLKSLPDSGSNIKEYLPEELREKYVFLDWLAVNLVYARPIKSKQFLLYGAPSTQKTLIINMLSKVLRIYFASSRSNDFAGADDYYDMWVYDEFHQSETSSMYGHSSYITAGDNTMLKVLDGQECRLDAKYSQIFTKKKNIPIVIISNEIVPRARSYGAFQARFFRLKFVTRLFGLDESRLIATLKGCILRRLGIDDLSKVTVNSTPLFYNEDRAQISKEEISSTISQSFLMKHTLNEEFFLLKEVEAQYNDSTNFSYLEMRTDPSQFSSLFLSALHFSFIPIKKKELSSNEEDDSVINSTYSPFPPFNSIIPCGNFRLYRTSFPLDPDYLIWPVRACLRDEERSWPVNLKMCTEEELESLRLSKAESNLVSLSSADSFLELIPGPVGGFSKKTLSSFSWDQDIWDFHD